MSSSKIIPTDPPYNCVQLSWNRKKAKSVFNDLKQIATNYEFGVDEEQEFYFRPISNEIVKRVWIGKGVRLFEPTEEVDQIINEYDVLGGEMIGGDNYILTVKDTDSQDLYGIRKSVLQLPECIPEFGSDLALGITPTTSPTGTGAANMTDGNSTTEWDSGANQTIGHYIQVDLGEVKNHLGKVRVDSANSAKEKNYSYADKFKILISSTGDFTGEEIEVFAATEDFGTADVPIPFPQTVGRYVRVVLTSGKDYHWRINRFEVYERDISDIERWATSILNDTKDPIRRGVLELDSISEKIWPRGKIRVTSEDGSSYYDYPIVAVKYHLSADMKLGVSLELGKRKRDIGDELLKQRRMLQEFAIAGLSRDADLSSGQGIQQGGITHTHIGRDAIETPMLKANSIWAEHYHELRNTIAFQDHDSLDGTYPFEMPFEIVAEMTAIVSVKLSFDIKNFRAYAKGVPSGGGHTTPSGGGATSGGSGTPSGGGSTSGSQGTPSGGGSTTGSQGTPSGGGSTSGSATHNHPGSTAESGGSHGHVVATHNRYGDYKSLYVNPNMEASSERLGNIPTSWNVGNHTHNLNITGDGAHSHSTPNHTHPGHTHGTPHHTHPSHTHTTPNHTHPNHTHSTPSHQHSVSNHTHSLTFGIFEEAQSPTINVFLDNGEGYGDSIGQYTTDQLDIDIASHVSGVGWKKVKFTSNKRTRISSIIMVKLDLTA